MGTRIWEHRDGLDGLIEHEVDGSNVTTLCGRRTWSDATDPANDPTGQVAEEHWFGDYDLPIIDITACPDCGITNKTRERYTATFEPEPGVVNVEQLHKLLAEGTAYIVNGEVKVKGEWEPRSDWGGYRLDGWGMFADALAWECGSCRPDVGWPKWDTAIRSFETGEVTIHVECGHCGNTYYYDADGNEQDED